MAKKKGGVEAVVREIAEPLAESLGYFIWDVEYVKEGSQWYLRITIDTENEAGIGIDDCEKMHRAIDPLLDEADPIEDAYNLEVSSPGIERELKDDMQIEACVDWQVEAKLFAPKDGIKVFKGILLGLDDEGRVAIKTGDGDEDITLLERKEIAKLATVYDFGD